jgi:hypothetical protein
VLLTLDNLADRSQYINARNTFTELLAYGTIPVVNENVSVRPPNVTGCYAAIPIIVAVSSCWHMTLSTDATVSCRTCCAYLQDIVAMHQLSLYQWQTG